MSVASEDFENYDWIKMLNYQKQSLFNIMKYEKEWVKR